MKLKFKNGYFFSQISRFCIVKMTHFVVKFDFKKVDNLVFSIES